MFVVLDVSDGLVQVAVWADARGGKAILDLAQELFDHRDSVFADDDALHFYRLHLSVPLMRSDICNYEPLLWVCVQNFPDEILCCLRDYTWDQVITVQDLLVQLAGIRVFERKITASHSIQNDTTAPNIRVKAVVLLSSDHLWGSIARTSAGCFEGLSLLVHI